MTASDIKRFFGGEIDEEKIYVLTGKQLKMMQELELRTRLFCLDGSIILIDRGIEGIEIKVNSAPC